MIDKPFLLSGFFSLGLHGALVSLLYPLFMSTSSDEFCTFNVVWEDTPTLSKPTSKSPPAPQKKEVQPKKVEKLIKTKEVAKSQSHYANSSAKPQVKSAPAGLYSSNRKEYRPLPTYPRICRKREQEGSVTVQATLNFYGQVIKVDLYKSSGYELLDKAALQAAKSWIFLDNVSPRELTFDFDLKGVSQR